ncbi:MAG: radical SAM protein [Oligoflexia bacterium]|nr:radical SAM protein [Oligoflexia bacterium]
MITNTNKNHFIFGPIKSRRLGISLGIDLIPKKICSLDCIYCECGKTLTLSIKREEFYPLNAVLDEIDKFFSTNSADFALEIDYITFSGQGEPTLYSKMGAVIEYLKKNYPQYKLALLTNSTLFYQEDLRKELLPLDLIVPSYDAASEDVFKKINRPHPQITAEIISNGLQQFRREFKGQVWVEVFIIPGINDSDEEIKRIKKDLEKFSPDKIQLNTLDRPGTESFIRPPSMEELTRLKSLFQPFEIEIINSKWNKTSFKNITQNITTELIEDTILNTIRRRPCTLDDLKITLGVSSNNNNIESVIKLLLEKKIIGSKIEERGEFYFLIK